MRTQGRRDSLIQRLFNSRSPRYHRWELLLLPVIYTRRLRREFHRSLFGSSSGGVLALDAAASLPVKVERLATFEREGHRNQ